MKRMKKKSNLLLGLLPFLFSFLVLTIQVRAAGNGYAMFPMKYLNVSNGESGHGGRLIIDLCGYDTGKDAFYAPFDGKVIRMNFGSSSSNVIIESTDPVKWADGTTDYIHMWLAHDDDISDLYVGKTFKQGEEIYREGTTGIATGNHVHMICGQGHYPTSGGLMETSSGWTLKNQVSAYKVFYLYSDTQVKGTGGYSWTTLTGSQSNYEGASTADGGRVVNTGVTNITDTTARINAAVSPAGDGTEFGFYLGTSHDNMQKKVEYASQPGCKSIWYDLGTGKWCSALQKGTTYYYQIYAVIGGVTYKSSIDSFTTTGDVQAPTISNVNIVDVTRDGYTVTCEVTDNVGVSKVCFPTWTDWNGQDDISPNWGESTAVYTPISGNTYAFRVNVTDHNNESGQYTTHIYAYDAAGNQSFSHAETLIIRDITSEFPLVDGGIYRLHNVNSGKVLEVPGASTEDSTQLWQWEVNGAYHQLWKAVKQNDGYSFIAVHSNKAMDLEGGTKESGGRIIQHTYYGSDNQRFKLVHRGEGAYSIHPVPSELAMEVYGNSLDNGAVIHQYAYNENSNQLFTFEYVDMEAPRINNVTITDVNRDGYTVTCEVTDDVGVSKVCFPTWSVANGRDDMPSNWGESTAVTSPTNGNTYNYRVSVSDHNHEGGAYITEIFAYDAMGNYSRVETGATVNRDIPLESIELSNSKLSLEEGQNYSLSVVAYNPVNTTSNKQVSWSTSDAKIATVDNQGKVTAVAAGNATITAKVGEKTASCNVIVNESKKQEENQEEQKTEQKPEQKPSIDYGLTADGVYVLSNDTDGFVAGMVHNIQVQAELEFRWTAYRTEDQTSVVVQDWKEKDYWLKWKPEQYGEYILTAEARVKEAPDVVVSTQSEAMRYTPFIKGKCQMPYYGDGGGYLIGIETFDNPNQSYTYEMLILDCTLLAEGKDAWIYTTGRCGVAEGNALWTVWQPQYGYYWTLFRVYDANGEMIDQDCYGFVNAF